MTEHAEALQKANCPDDVQMKSPDRLERCIGKDGFDRKAGNSIRKCSSYFQIDGFMETPVSVKS
jgi:hypothetical protein